VAWLHCKAYPSIATPPYKVLTPKQLPTITQSSAVWSNIFYSGFFNVQTIANEEKTKNVKESNKTVSLGSELYAPRVIQVSLDHIS
jgi:hypothetical protein